jgi:hypothetical protein
MIPKAARPEVTERASAITAGLTKELPAVRQPILVPATTEDSGVWNKRWRTYTDYVNTQDRRLKATLDAGFSVFVLLLKPSVFATWCEARKLPVIMETLDSYDEQGTVYPYDGNLWHLVRLHQVTADLAQEIKRQGAAEVSPAIEQLETAFCDLMSRTILQSAGADGLVVVTAYKERALQAGQLADTHVCELPMVGGRWMEQPPSLFLLARVCTLLGQLNGGQLDLHLYPAGSQSVYSTTYWLPWGSGKTGTGLPQ